jgi:hypothetical protein
MTFEHFEGTARVALDKQTMTQNNLPEDFEKGAGGARFRGYQSSSGREYTLDAGASSWLLHYVVDETTVQLLRIAFATDYAVNHLYKKYGENEERAIKLFIHKALDSSLLGMAGGRLSEPLATRT